MDTDRRQFDLIIIGAGSVGTPTALFAGRAGLATLVIDAGASVGQGANKTAIGGIRATHSDPAKIAVGLRSLEIFSTWKEQTGEEIEWHRGGYSFVAYREHEEQILRRLLQIQTAHGLDISWLGRDELLRVIPSLNPDGLLGGTFSPGDGHASPLLAAHAFYRHARAAGVTFRFRETVQAIDVRGGRVESVRTDNATYHAPVVINAAGASARQIAALAGCDLPVQPESHEAGITEAVARFLEPMVVDIRSAPGSANFYFYQHLTGQIIFCITPDPPIEGFDRRETSAFLPMVSRRMISIMPALAHIKVRRTWRGLYPMSPDGSPLVGESPEAAGLIHAAGMCGQGFMLGPGLATYLAKQAAGGLSAEERQVLDAFSPQRSFARIEALK